MNFQMVVGDDSEAAIGGGILSAILEMSHSQRIKEVVCDPTQTGDACEMFVRMRGAPTDVWLRLAVTEVEPVP